MIPFLLEHIFSGKSKIMHFNASKIFLECLFILVWTKTVI